MVEANPGRVNDRDRHGNDTPLIVAARREEGLSLVVWVLDEKGADVNVTMADGRSALHWTRSLDILTALLDRGADPTTTPVYDGGLPLMYQAGNGSVEVVQRLLEDPRVRATVNMQDGDGFTALHCVCAYEENSETAFLKANILLQADLNPTITDNDGDTPLDYCSTNNALFPLLEQYPAAKKDAEKASLLVKARRLAVAANSNAVSPSCLQAWVALWQPLPRVALIPPTDGHNEGEEEEGEEGRKLRTTLAFLCGVGREGMPRGVFRVVMDLLMPSWDPLRRKNTGTGPSAVQG